MSRSNDRLMGCLGKESLWPNTHRRLVQQLPGRPSGNRCVDFVGVRHGPAHGCVLPNMIAMLLAVVPVKGEAGFTAPLL